MKAGAVLAQWLGDREAQARSFERLDALGRSWRLRPPIRDIENELDAPGSRSSEALVAAARRFMDRYDDIEALVRDLIAGSRADPFFAPPLRATSNDIQTGLTLFDHPNLAISIGVIGIDTLASNKAERPASIEFTGRWTLLRFLKSGGCTLSFWEAPRITDCFMGSEAGACRMVGRRRLSDGEEVLVDGRCQSLVIEHANADILFLQALARADSAPVGTQYDRDSLRFIGASSADDSGTRVQLTVALLRAMGRDDAFPLLEDLLESPHFHTRWHVMREMLAMDPEAAVPALRRMAAEDPHPDVRAAAEQTLQLLFQPAECGSFQGAAACLA